MSSTAIDLRASSELARSAATSRRRDASRQRWRRRSTRIASCRRPIALVSLV